MSTIILETKRCIVRPFTEHDFDLIYSIHSDPEVMFYIGQGARTKEQSATHLENIIRHQNTYGYSAWAVHEKETGNFIGRVGLVHIGTIIAMEQTVNSNQPVEIGYVISKAYWGKGYTSEVASACLDWGFKHTDLEEIVAKTNIANYASQRILEKIGMSFKHHIMIEGRQGMYFTLSRQDFLALAE